MDNSSIMKKATLKDMKEDLERRAHEQTAIHMGKICACGHRHPIVRLTWSYHGDSGGEGT